jgi:NADH-quinone oxidoreductase subunit G
MAEPTEAAPVPFVLDGRAATARPGEMLISAAERAGVYIPRFCYHPRMRPVGMCRMCLVEVEGPRGPSLQPSCFIPVTDGMAVTTTSDRVKKAQDGVLEFLLVNHPLDCPVCDKGGECPLQDQTLSYGPGESRFVEEKRHFEKPIALSELVLLDRERCIQCARCTRFADEVAGEAQIDFAGRGEQVEVATFPDRPFTSYFSGNTVQICPVGALTASPYRFTARPWDVEQVESTCTTCAFGCRVAVQSSADRVTRLLGIDADPVNHGWLCDKGRFAYEAVNGPVDRDREAAVGRADEPRPPEETATKEPATGERGPARLTEPMVRKDGELVAVSWGEALAAAAAGLAEARDAGGEGAVAVLGGARLTNEACYAWSKLARTALRTDSVDAQLADGLPAELVLSLPRATIDETCRADTVVLLAGDLREELPVLFLRLRAAVTGGSTQLVELSSDRTSLSGLCAARLALRPGDAPAAARALVGDDGAAAALRGHPEGPAFGPAELEAARRLVADGGRGVVVVVGRSSVAESADLVAEAARVLADALPEARFLPALRRGNVMGALDMGLSPGLLPGRVGLEEGRDWFARSWGRVPAARGLDTTGVLSALASGQGAPRALVLVGTDLLGDVPDRQLAEQALAAARFVVSVTGSFPGPGERPDVVLPAAVAHERPGTTTNVEGRVSRLSQKVVAPGVAWPDWIIAAELAASLGDDLGVTSLAGLAAEIERLAPAHAGLTGAVLDAPGARDGVVVPMTDSSPGPAPAPLDPMALPGVDAPDRQGAPLTVGLTELPSAGPPAVRAPAGERPSLLVAGPPPPPVAVPAADSYSLRLVSGRRLYDGGWSVAASPSLAPLTGPAVARANPYDLDRLGVGTGDLVRVRSPRGSLVLEAQADEGVPRGVVAVDVNLGVPGGADNAAARLIDATAVVTDVRLETP